MKQFISKRVTLAALVIFALAIAVGCSKKQADCPDREYYEWLKNNKPTMSEWLKDNLQLKSAAEEDPCEDQRTALEQGVADSIQYASDVRAGFLAMPDPSTNFGYYYWRDFDNWFLPRENLVDSTIIHRIIAEIWWERYGDPLPVPSDDSLLRNLYNDGGMYLNQCDTMPTLREDLKKCEDENPVGIDELEWEDWNDGCGGGQWRTVRP